MQWTLEIFGTFHPPNNMTLPWMESHCFYGLSSDSLKRRCPDYWCGKACNTCNAHLRWLFVSVVQGRWIICVDLFLYSSFSSCLLSNHCRIYPQHMSLAINVSGCCSMCAVFFYQVDEKLWIRMSVFDLLIFRARCWDSVLLSFAWLPLLLLRTRSLPPPSLWMTRRSKKRF